MAGYATTRKSTSGYIFNLAGATVSWKSLRKTVVASSSTEAEYITLRVAAHEAIWLRGLLASLSSKESKAIKLYEDNQGAIALTKNPKTHFLTKHISIKYHYIREAVDTKDIELAYCPADEMVANILTIGLFRPKFDELRSLSAFKILDKIQDHTHCQNLNASINAETWLQSDGQSKVEENVIVSYRVVLGT